VRNQTPAGRVALHARVCALVARRYREPLTLELAARALASSPRQLQRAYAQFGGGSFGEDLRSRRLRAAAELLAGQPSIPVAVVARLVGYRQAPHLAKVFRAHYGLAPAAFRRDATAAGRRPGVTQPPADGTAGAASGCSSSSPGSSGSRGAASAPGRRSRIRVPPPGAGSAVTVPPC
jgi:AraC-like DNA-binding protein